MVCSLCVLFSEPCFSLAPGVHAQSAAQLTGYRTKPPCAANRRGVGSFRSLDTFQRDASQFGVNGPVQGAIAWDSFH
jgi:hypothetical protein